MAQSILRDAWFGVGVKSGGHLIAGGYESTTGIAVNASNPAWNYTFAIENARFGPGLGGTLGGGAILIILNCHNMYTLNDTDVSDWSFNFGIGAKWSGVLKFWQAAGLFKTAQQMRNALKVTNKIQKVVTTENAEAIKQSINYMWNAYDMARSSQPTIFTIDIPGTGISAELSLAIMQGKFSII